MRLRQWWSRRRPPRLAVVLIALNALLLVLPLSGVWALRIYESALVRQTETELTAQGVVIAATARVLLALPPATESGDADWQPRLPQLDLARSPLLLPLPEPEPLPPGAEPASPRMPADAAAQLATVLHESQRHTLAALRVTDATGRVIAASNPQWLGHSLQGHLEVQAALAGRAIATLRQRAVDEKQGDFAIGRARGLRVVVAVPIVSGDRVVGAVEVLRTPATIGQTLWAKRDALLVALLALIAAAALATWLALRLILRPLAGLRASAEAAAGGAPYTPPVHRGLAEFAALDRSVARMAESLHQRAAYIRDFAAHVSHEFKTPLASILASTELLADHAQMDEVQRSRFVALIDAEATRLSQLTQRLLELARAETASGGGACVPVTVMARLVQRHREQGQDVRIDADLDAGAEVTMPADLLDTCLGTLLDNARVHGGAVVTLGATTTGDVVILEVTDDGDGVSDANAVRLFTPFFTTARAAGHTGLGLSIARALVRAHGGELDLASARPARFRMRLPRTPRPADADR